MKPDYVFCCKKCGHLLFIPKPKKILKPDCPDCGEEPYMNWILLRMGNYEEEYDKKD